jgi:hypothetical protein
MTILPSALMSPNSLSSVPVDLFVCVKVVVPGVRRGDDRGGTMPAEARRTPGPSPVTPSARRPSVRERRSDRQRRGARDVVNLHRFWLAPVSIVNRSPANIPTVDVTFIVVVQLFVPQAATAPVVVTAAGSAIRPAWPTSCCSTSVAPRMPLAHLYGSRSSPACWSS